MNKNPPRWILIYFLLASTVVKKMKLTRVTQMCCLLLCLGAAASTPAVKTFSLFKAGPSTGWIALALIKGSGPAQVLVLCT